MSLFSNARRYGATRRHRAAPTWLIIQTQLESGADIFWRLTVDDVQQIDAPDSGAVVSFATSDYRFAASRPLTAEQAKSLAVREAESEERMRVVNMSRPRGRIYAAPVSRLNQVNYRIAPGMQVLDALTDARGIHQPGVVGLLAASQDNQRRLVILQAVNAAGRVEIAVSVNPEDVDQAVALFVNALRLPEDCPRLIFSPRDFLGAASELLFFSREPEWYGISTRSIAMLSILIVMTAALASAGLAVFHHLRAQSAGVASTEIETQLQQVERDIGVLMSTAPIAVSQQTSLSVARVLDRAQAMWLEGTRVSVRADRASTEYKITLPLTSGASPHRAHVGAVSATQLEAINAVLRLQPPAGCLRRDNTMTGLANDVQVAITCQDHRSLLPL